MDEHEQNQRVLEEAAGERKRKSLHMKVFTLKDLVVYQNGTIASRMLMNKPTGCITIFSFDENEGLSDHTAPFDAMVTILDGECKVGIAGEMFAMQEGQTIIFPANVTHSFSAITRFKMLLTMIRD